MEAWGTASESRQTQGAASTSEPGGQACGGTQAECGVSCAGARTPDHVPAPAPRLCRHTVPLCHSSPCNSTCLTLPDGWGFFFFFPLLLHQQIKKQHPNLSPNMFQTSTCRRKGEVKPSWGWGLRPAARPRKR